MKLVRNSGRASRPGGGGSPEAAAEEGGRIAGGVVVRRRGAGEAAASKVARTAWPRPRAPASRSAVSRNGLLSPRSSAWMLRTLTPAASASASCVSPAASRCSLSNWPNTVDVSLVMTLPRRLRAHAVSWLRSSRLTAIISSCISLLGSGNTRGFPALHGYGPRDQHRSRPKPAELSRCA
jgi:hypothetical protein